METGFIEAPGGPLSDHWTAEYENILEFYFWEPGHLNRVSPPPSRRRPPAQVFGALMKREVPLNHQLNIFFRLAPRSLIARWLDSRLKSLAWEAPHLTDPLAYRKSRIYGACQADLWFEDRAARAFVELKVDAKSSLQQLCKYALLQASLLRTHGAKPAGIIFLGRADAHFAAIAAHIARRCEPDFEVPARVLNHASRLGLSAEEVLRCVTTMDVAYADYATFDAHLADETPRRPADDGQETLHRLIAGMRAFLATTVLDGVSAP